MKRNTFVMLFLLAALLSAKPAIKFKSTTLDFGEVTSGKIVDINFEFENTAPTSCSSRTSSPPAAAPPPPWPKRITRPEKKE